AIVLQRGMTERNADAAEDRRIEVRIGINLGDVIIEDQDRYGEGVNIAARMQQLAQPGGIWVSHAVYEHVSHKLPVVFDPLGERPLKNMTGLISIYSVRTSEIRRGRLETLWSGRARWRQWAAAAIAASAVVAAVVWFIAMLFP